MELERIVEWLDGLGRETALLVVALIWCWREIRRQHLAHLAEKDRCIQFLKNELVHWKAGLHQPQHQLVRKNEKNKFP